MEVAAILCWPNIVASFVDTNSLDLHPIVLYNLHPVGKYLFKVSKITLEQRPDGRCSNVILLTLNRYLSTGVPATFIMLLTLNKNLPTFPFNETIDKTCSNVYNGFRYMSIITKFEQLLSTG